jgi:hypothetical protein
VFARCELDEFMKDESKWNSIVTAVMDWRN